MEIKLEKRPCCGGKAQIRYIGHGSGKHGYTSNIYMRSEKGFVVCLKCGLQTSDSGQRVCRAVEKWNKRSV